MDKTFDTLYNEFRGETDGGGHIFVNNRAGYQRWYKDKLFRLCLKYKQASQQSVEADAKCNCVSGKSQSTGGCPVHGRKENSMKCDWKHTGDGEFITGCYNEFVVAQFDNEELLQGHLNTYCPFCGEKINQIESEI